MLRPLVAALYGGVADVDALCRQLVDEARLAHEARPPALRRLDARREADPAWFQAADRIGYVAYADRFGGTLAGVRRHLDHLADLHVTYFHLMKVLRARVGPNDGGYAIVDYADVDPSLGTRADLDALAGDLRERGDQPLARRRDEPHRPRARVGAGGASGIPPPPRLLPRLPRPDDARSLRSNAARGLPRARAGQLHLGARARRLGLDDVQLVSVGPELREPRRVRRDVPGDGWTSPTWASRSCASTRSPSRGSDWARTARTSPRRTCSPRPIARCWRSWPRPCS